MRDADAHAIFRRERARFARAFPHVARARLTLFDAPCPPHKRACAPRDLGWTYTATGEVYLLRRALRLPRANVVALIRHELAHVAMPDLSEVETDGLAGVIGGRPIRYARAEVQTLGPGGPRPRHLHR